MYFWQIKREKLTEEQQSERSKYLLVKAEERIQKINQNMDRAIAKLEQDKRDIDDMRKGGGPGPFDDSAGKARIC